MTGGKPSHRAAVRPGRVRQLDGQPTGNESVAAGGDRRHEARQWGIDRHFVQTRVPRCREVVGPSRSDEREHERDGRRAVGPHRGVTFRFEPHDLVRAVKGSAASTAPSLSADANSCGGPRQLPETVEGQLQPPVRPAVGVLRSPRVRGEQRPIAPRGQLVDGVLGQRQPTRGILGEPACEHQRGQLDRVADSRALRAIGPRSSPIRRAPRPRRRARSPCEHHDSTAARARPRTVR